MQIGQESQNLLSDQLGYHRLGTYKTIAVARRQDWITCSIYDTIQAKKIDQSLFDQNWLDPDQHRLKIPDIFGKAIISLHKHYVVPYDKTLKYIVRRFRHLPRPLQRAVVIQTYRNQDTSTYTDWSTLLVCRQLWAQSQLKSQLCKIWIAAYVNT